MIAFLLVMFFLLIVPTVTLCLYDKDGWAFFYMLFLIGSACYYDDHTHGDVCEAGIVEDIGGCNRYGECMVRLTNGKIGIANYPLKGEKTKICKREQKPFSWSNP